MPNYGLHLQNIALVKQVTSADESTVTAPQPKPENQLARRRTFQYEWSQMVRHERSGY